MEQEWQEWYRKRMGPILRLAGDIDYGGTDYYMDDGDAEYDFEFEEVEY